MKKVAVLLALLLAASAALAQNKNVQITARLIWDSNESLQPGIHAWILGPVSANRGYVVETTPLDTDPSLLIDGEYVRAFVEPEYNGTDWFDVLRVDILPENTPGPLNLNVRVYALELRK